MFSGKREKALLEEELAALRETEKRERELLHKIAGQIVRVKFVFVKKPQLRIVTASAYRTIERRQNYRISVVERGIERTFVFTSKGFAEQLAEIDLCGVSFAIGAVAGQKLGNVSCQQLGFIRAYFA